MHQAEKKAAANRKVKHHLKELLDEYKKKPTEKNYGLLCSSLDKAEKTHVIHKNKVARLKSRMAKLLPTKKKSS